MIDHLLIHSVRWKKNTGQRNKNGHFIYSAEEDVKVRVEKVSQVLKEGFSDKLVDKAELFSTKQIKITDKFIYEDAEWEILGAESATTAAGVVIYFLEAYSHGKGSI